MNRDPASVVRREWLAHLGVVWAGVLAGLVAVATTINDDPFPDGSGPLMFDPGVDLAIGVAAACLLVLRKRWPFLVAMAVIAVGVVSTTAFGAGLVALFCVALRSSWRKIAVTVVVHMAPVLLLWLLALPLSQYLEGVVFIVLVDATLVASALLVRSLRDRARQAEESRVRDVAEARRHERQRIAREMHDVLAHRISLLAVHAGALEYRPDAPPEQVRSAVAVIRASAYEALEELRVVIGVLREHGGAADDVTPEAPQPTLAQLAALVDESRRSGTRVDLDCAVQDTAGVPVAIGRHAYRIAQEGLTNARKHAPGARVRVAVAGTPGGLLTVELRNRVGDGGSRGSGSLLPGAGAGLIGLRERADLVGGRLEHGRTTDGDFRLWAALPWPT